MPRFKRCTDLCAGICKSEKMLSDLVLCGTRNFYSASRVNGWIKSKKVRLIAIRSPDAPAEYHFLCGWKNAGDNAYGMLLAATATEAPHMNVYVPSLDATGSAIVASTQTVFRRMIRSHRREHQAIARAPDKPTRLLLNQETMETTTNKTGKT